MLAASPVLPKPEPPSSTEHGRQSIRYGSHPTTAYSPKSQSAFAFVPTSGTSLQPPHRRMSRSSPSPRLRADHDIVTAERDAAGDGSQDEGFTSRGHSHNAETSSSLGLRPQEKSVASSGARTPFTRQVDAESPSIKRRQQSTPPLTVGAGTSSAASTSPLKRPKTQKKESKTLPLHYEHCEVEDIVILIADMIAELIHTNDNLPLQDGVLTRFHSRTPPGISVIDYLQRLAKHAALTPPLLLSMVYYIDLLCSKYTSFTITTLTVHRFLITAATVAAKGLSDSFWNNSTYARVGGIKLAELGLLELDFLHRVDWRIVPVPEVLVDYYLGLVSRSDKYELDGKQRKAVPAAPALQHAQDGSGTESAPSEASCGPEDARTDNKWEKWMKDVADEADR